MGSTNSTLVRQQPQQQHPIQFLDLPKELRLMVYERIPIGPYYQNIRFHRSKELASIRIATYGPIPPIYLASQAICIEATPILKSRARAHRQPRTIIFAPSDEALQDAAPFFRSLLHQCYRSRSLQFVKANLCSLAADLRTAQPCNTVPPHCSLSKEEQQAVADFATFAAKYHGRWGGLSGFPPSWIRLALVTEGVSDQAVWRFFDHVRCISKLYAQRMGSAVTVFEVNQGSWRAPAKGWYTNGTEIQYGGVVDRETWKRKWAVDDACKVSPYQE